MELLGFFELLIVVMGVLLLCALILLPWVYAMSCQGVWQRPIRAEGYRREMLEGVRVQLHGAEKRAG